MTERGTPITNHEIERLRDRFADQFESVFSGLDIGVVAMLLAYEGAAAVSLADRGVEREELADCFREAFEERLRQFEDIEVALDRRRSN